MQVINREELLQNLESLVGGLAVKEIVDQSACFAFVNGHAYTYNDEVSCSRPVELKLTGAVKARQLLDLLRKMEETEIEIGIEDGFLLVNGKRRRAKIQTEMDIVLPFDRVEKAEKWKKLQPGFSEALEYVAEAAGKDESNFKTTCIHIHPQWVEATDGYQASRAEMKTGLKSSAFIRRFSVGCIIAVGPLAIAETDSWLHFKCEGNLVLSCRKYIEEDYPDLSKTAEVEGNRVTFPPSIAQALERAEIFSQENTGKNLVRILLKDDNLILSGTGPSGTYQEAKRLKYGGESFSFLIAPKKMKSICEKNQECVVSDRRLLITGEKSWYVCALEWVEPDKKPATDKKKKKKDEE